MIQKLGATLALIFWAVAAAACGEDELDRRSAALTGSFKPSGTQPMQPDIPGCSVCEDDTMRIVVSGGLISIQPKVQTIRPTILQFTAGTKAIRSKNISTIGWIEPLETKQRAITDEYGNPITTVWSLDYEIDEGEVADPWTDPDHEVP